MKCPVASYEYKTDEIEMVDARWMLEMHERHNHVVTVPVGHGQQQVRPEKVRRPQLVVKEGFVTEEAFDYFIFVFGGGGIHNALCYAWSGRLRGSK